MGQIVTLTVNPSVDKSTTVKSIVPEQKLRCESPKYEPGGGGINVSRAISQLGGTSKAIFFAGGHMGKFFTELIDQHIKAYEIININEDTRENFIVVESTSNNQYRFGMEGPSIREEEWQQSLTLLNSINDIEFLVASGSLSPGIPKDYYAKVAKIAKSKGASFILDTSGEPLRLAANEGVYLLKPNLSELSALAGVEELQLDQVDEQARKIIDQGQCEAVVVSLGGSGALLVTKDIVEHIPAPPVKKNSTVGAGDSMVAGMVLTLFNKGTFSEAARYGVACGTAATMNFGTELCHKDDADSLFVWINKRMNQ